MAKIGGLIIPYEELARFLHLPSDCEIVEILRTDHCQKTRSVAIHITGPNMPEQLPGGVIRYFPYRDLIDA